MVSEPLRAFVDDLAGAQIGETFNFYAHAIATLDVDDACDRRRANLLAHLSARLDRCRFMLVGEAPGFNGARFSGVAFTSERSLAPEHRSSRRPDGFKEPSATILGGQLEALGIDEVTVRWNSVPFHPHELDAPLTNRKPTELERREGLVFLQRLVEIMRPEQIIAVGRVAERSLPGSVCVRHPARGGATQFRQQMADLVHGAPPA